MKIQSINPATEEILASFDELTDAEIEEKLSRAQRAFESWREVPIAQRATLMNTLGELIKKKDEELGKLTTLEMGRPQRAASNVKSAWACEYYAENTLQFLKEEHIHTESSESYVRFDPLGVILAVMPWNYPFWQVMRFAAPALMAGNVGILKHASNVPQVALKIEELFREAGFPEGVFQTLLVGSKKVESIIRDSRVKAVTLTGSEYAGSQVAKTAGQEIKKVVLELGGSDPFIVFEDADIPITCDAATEGRLLNAGQSCIAAKRFIVHESRFDEFVKEFKTRFERQVVGDPTDPATQIGPLATKSILTELEEQVQRAVKAGATIVTGGTRLDQRGYYYQPTILTGVTPDMPLYQEEIFGPVALIFSFKTDEEAMTIANGTPFGLGASVWTRDSARAKRLIPHIEAGFVSVNELVKSDPRLPFGGIKKSGYGRELSHYGIKEFVNIKTVKIK